MQNLQPISARVFTFFFLRRSKAELRLIRDQRTGHEEVKNLSVISYSDIKNQWIV